MLAKRDYVPSLIGLNSMEIESPNLNASNAFLSNWDYDIAGGDFLKNLSIVYL